MVRLTDSNGLEHYLAAANVARITEAGASSQWHGVRCHVTLFDGAVIDCQQDAKTVAALVEKASQEPTNG